MSATWWPIGIAMGVASLGALLAVVLRDAGSRLMRPLVYVALLFFGLSAVFDILPASKLALSWPAFLIAAGTGYGVCWLISQYVAPICPACAMSQVRGAHHHAHGLGLVFLATFLSLHCFLDGLGVSTASAMEASFGLRLLAATTVHKLPEGFAMTLLLIVGGRPPWRALVVATLIEGFTVVGAITGGVVHPSEFWRAVVLANIGGTFIFLTVSGLWDALTPTRQALPAQS